MKILSRVLAGSLVGAVVLGLWLWNSHRGQNWLLEQAVKAVVGQPPRMTEFDGLRVFMCGTSSPLPAPGRAQACVLIQAGESLYIVDAGAGSAQTLAVGRIPLERLDAVLLTHFHSDHFSALPDIALNSWVAGRPKPLKVYGPAGVGEVVEGLNLAYRLDRQYRVAHHGAELLPPALGVLEAETLDQEGVVELGELSITSFPVEHRPVHPAVGYRFDYRGRSVVVSGDSIVSSRLIAAATDADLLLHDALSPTLVETLERAAAGTRLEKIFFDIQDYHAHTTDLAGLVAKTGVKTLALYHLVPPPQNALFEKIFSRDLPDDTVITHDGLVFDLPADSGTVVIN